MQCTALANSAVLWQFCGSNKEQITIPHPVPYSRKNSSRFTLKLVPFSRPMRNLELDQIQFLILYSRKLVLHSADKLASYWRTIRNMELELMQFLIPYSRKQFLIHREIRYLFAYNKVCGTKTRPDNFSLFANKEQGTDFCSSLFII